MSVIAICSPIDRAFIPSESPTIHQEPVGCLSHEMLNQDRTAIHHHRMPGAKSFLHQKQIGLRYVMSLADSANRETLCHAFVQVLAFCRAHVPPEVRPNHS